MGDSSLPSMDMLIWLLAIIAFGYPAIIIPALALVPTVFVLLILITTG